MTRVFYIFTLLCFYLGVHAQVVIADFESPESSVYFQYFGSSLEPGLTTVEDNPAPVGINESSKVLKFIKAANSQTWAGGFANPAISAPVDGNVIAKVCVDVWMDHIGNFTLKLEKNGGSDPDNYIQTVANTKINEWETLCFDLSLPALEGNMTPGTGKVFPGLTIFPDFGSAFATDQVYYFDNMIAYPGETITSILDFETAATGAFFQYFGSSLEPQLTTIEDNPMSQDPNSSAKVMKYIKAAGSQTWAGAFANPPISEAIDATVVTHVCVDVLMDHIGNFTLKLEKNGGSDPDNYVQTVANSKVNEWETLCFDLALPSLEGNMSPGTGKVFPGLTIFPDFGSTSGEDVTYYFDNFVKKSSSAPTNKNVTFSINMKNYSNSYTSVYVSGDFNNWSGDAMPLSDDDLDGIWTGTYSLPNGTYQFKFTIDNWTDQENLLRTDECSITDPSGQFTNRRLVVAGDMTYGTVCYGSCYNCDDEVNIIWNLGIGGQFSPDPSGVYLAGGAQFGAPGGNYLMTDPDGDGVFSIRVRRAKGYSTYYSFTNGNCPDFSCKENIGGQDCARPENFNDRFLDPVTADLVINTCYGACTTTTDCGATVPKGKATFSVDMKGQTVAGKVYISGQLINNWSPDATPMSDADGDGIYTYTMELPAANVEYKFINGDQWETLNDGDDCTITDPSGQFTNRLLVMGTQDTVLNIYQFGTCSITSDVNDVLLNQLISLTPNITNDNITITWDESLRMNKVELFNTQGNLSKTMYMNGKTQSTEISVAELSSSIYFAKISLSDGTFVVKKIIKL